MRFQSGNRIPRASNTALASIGWLTNRFQSGNRIPRASNGSARDGGRACRVFQSGNRIPRASNLLQHGDDVLLERFNPATGSPELRTALTSVIAAGFGEFQSGNRIPRASNPRFKLPHRRGVVSIRQPDPQSFEPMISAVIPVGMSFNPATGSPELRTPDVTDRTGMRRKHRKSSTAHKLRPMTICYYYSTSTMALECSILHASDSRHLCLSFAARFTVRQ